MLSPSDETTSPPGPTVPPLRFVVVLSIVLLALYQAGAFLVLAGFDRPRLALFLAGPVFLLAPLVAMLRRAGLPLRETLRLHGAPGPSLVLGSAALLAWLPAVLVLAERLVEVPEPLEEFFGELLRVRSGGELVFVLAAAALAPAITEEIFFRGFLQGSLEARFGRWGGILVTAAAFGLTHGPARAPTATLLGILLGWLAARSGSVWPSVAAHAAVNTAAVALVNAEMKEGAEAATDAASWSMAIAGAALGLLFLRSFHRSLRS